MYLAVWVLTLVGGLVFLFFGSLRVSTWVLGKNLLSLSRGIWSGLFLCWCWAGFMLLVFPPYWG